MRSCCDRLVLHAGVDQLRQQRAATGRCRTDDEAADRPAEQGAEQQPPHAGADAGLARRDVGGLAHVRLAVGIAGDEHSVVQLDLVVVLQPRDGEQELLRPQAVLEAR